MSVREARGDLHRVGSTIVGRAHRRGDAGHCEAPDDLDVQDEAPRTLGVFATLHDGLYVQRDRL